MSESNGVSSQTQSAHEQAREEGKTVFRVRIENASESFIFASRWALAPLYLGLALALVILAARFAKELFELVQATGWGLEAPYEDIILAILKLLDITLLANLVLIVLFAGYETFVSKIGVAENSIDRPKWMGKVDFSGMKIKLIGSLVAISLISLLQDFLLAGPPKNEISPNEVWRVGIHIVFVTTGVLFAIMDRLAALTLIAEEKAGIPEIDAA
jgi:uncharacterized protein (TIGR00645 family)